MILLGSSFFVFLCLAADLRGRTEDSYYISRRDFVKIPDDVWYIVLSAGNFDFAPELALTSMGLQACVHDASYYYLMEKVATNELLDEDRILCLMPFFLKYLKTAKHDPDLRSTFIFFFTHAKCHNYASKIFMAWKSLGLTPMQDSALVDALQESVGFPVENPIPIYFLRVKHIYGASKWYSYIYPTILLNCRPISNVVWTLLFHAVLQVEYGGQNVLSAEERANFAVMKIFTAEVWSVMTGQQQDDSLRLISRTLLFYTGNQTSSEFISVSEATMRLVGSCLTELSCSDLQEELESMDEPAFQNILILGPRFHISNEHEMIRFWAAKVDRVRQLCSSISSSQRALQLANFELLNDYKAWNASKLAILSSLACGPSLNDQIRRKIARHVWEVPDLEGMLTFSFIISKKLPFLAEALKDFIKDSGSALICITVAHLKFIDGMKSKVLYNIISERATAELLQIVESYEPGQLPSPFDARLVDPDVAVFIRKCIKEEPLLATNNSFYALLQLLPNLKQFF